MSYKQLYHENLVDHYKHPRNKGTLAVSDFSSGVFNPSCGDEVNLCGLIVKGIITECFFEAKGCVISSAAASMLTEKVKGLSVIQGLALTKDTMLTLITIELGPTRLRCALLPLEALHTALKEYQKRSDNVAQSSFTEGT